MHHVPELFTLPIKSKVREEKQSPLGEIVFEAPRVAPAKEL
jgi:hypothetical protein